MPQESKPNILIIGNPHNHPSAEAFLKKIVNIIKEVGRNVYVISADAPSIYNNIVWFKLQVDSGGNVVKRFFKFGKNQLELILILIKNLKKFDIVIILPTTFIFPVIFLRLTKKKVAIFVAQKPDTIAMRIFARLNFIFSNLLIVESENVLNSWKILWYKWKSVNGAVYVDTEFFKREKEIKDREEIIGYVGGLEKEKGVRELIYAISILNFKKQKIKYIIGGVGSLENMIRGISDSTVEFKGFIPKDELSGVLNELTLLVLPSYTEGLPNIILEAMACGTPVLATPVGGISDVIKDEETGFIMETNSPECIAENVIRALEHPNLDEMVKNARKLIEEKYTYEAAVERYRKILENI